VAVRERPRRRPDELFALNVKVPYFLTAALAPGMAERGTGVIVNVSTMIAEFGLDGMALYGSTKAALELLTKAWSAEFGPKGIRVNAVAPGPISTEGTEGMREAQGYWPRSHRPGDWAPRRRSPQPSFTWPRRRRHSLTVSCSRSAAAGSPSKQVLSSRRARRRAPARERRRVRPTNHSDSKYGRGRWSRAS